MQTWKICNQYLNYILYVAVQICFDIVDKTCIYLFVLVEIVVVHSCCKLYCIVNLHDKLLFIYVFIYFYMTKLYTRSSHLLHVELLLSNERPQLQESANEDGAFPGFPLSAKFLTDPTSDWENSRWLPQVRIKLVSK